MPWQHCCLSPHVLPAGSPLLHGARAPACCIPSRLHGRACCPVLRAQATPDSPPVEKPVPQLAYFQGSIQGQPGSVALVSVAPNGAVDGLVLGSQTAEQQWTLSKPGAPTGGSAAAVAAAVAAPMTAQAVDPSAASERPAFTCGNDDHSHDYVVPTFAAAAAALNVTGGSAHRKMLQVRCPAASCAAPASGSSCPLPAYHLPDGPAHPLRCALLWLAW